MKLLSHFILVALLVQAIDKVAGQHKLAELEYEITTKMKSFWQRLDAIENGKFLDCSNHLHNPTPSRAKETGGRRFH